MSEYGGYCNKCLKKQEIQYVIFVIGIKILFRVCSITPEGHCVEDKILEYYNERNNYSRRE